MKIKVVTAYRGECPYREEVTANLAEYCDRWGYTLVAKFDDFPPLPRDNPVWTKHQTIMAEFHDCDWLFWVDADCMVIDMTVSLTAFIDDSFDLGVTGPFAATKHCDGCKLTTGEVVSAGVMLLRHCEWSHKFLADWWNSDVSQWQPPRCTWGGDSGWLACYVMQRPELASHVRVFPLAVMGWATYTGEPSQFLMHFYGGTTPQQFHLHESHVIR